VVLALFVPGCAMMNDESAFYVLLGFGVRVFTMLFIVLLLWCTL